MNRKLKKMMATGMLLVMSVTAGCGNKTKTKEATEEGFCTDISVFDCMYDPSFCDKGIVTVEDGLMIFYEYETGKSYPLCSDAYCEHLPYDEKTNPDPVCEATLKDLERACIHGDYVYAIQNTGIQEITVQARNLKESGYRVVATLPYCQTFSSEGYNAIMGDKAYLLLAEIDDLKDDGMSLSYTSNDLYTYLVELDLKTGEYKTLFHIEGDEKYKVLYTVYGEDGIYCCSYYEDFTYGIDDEGNTDFTDFKLNEYREVLHFIPYDGSEIKEVCPELAEMIAVSGGVFPEIMISGIGERGAYLTNKEYTKIECYRYDGGKETVYEVPAEYKTLSYVGVCEDKLLMELQSSDGTYTMAGYDLTTGELLLRDDPENASYSMICGEGFWKTWESGDAKYKELWTYEEFFSENGKPLLAMIEE